MPEGSAATMDRFGADDAFQGDVCDIDSINPRAVATARESMIQDDQAAELAEIFGVLGDPTRIKMISALMGSELCVCDLAALLGMSQSATSHQLRILRNLNLVRTRKEGRIVFYALDDEHIRDLFQRGLEHIRHNSQG